jgi:hypothetical protein
MQKKRKICGLSAVAAAVAGVGLLVGAPGAASAASAKAFGPAPASSQVLLSLADRAQQTAKLQSGFVGVAIDPDGVHVDVYFSEPHAAMAAIEDGGAVTRVQYVPHSAQVLSGLQSLIDRDRASLAQSFGLYAYGTSPRADSVVLYVRGGVSKLRALLQAKYGHATAFKIVNSGPAGGAQTASSRLNDAAPWNGGDFTAMDNGEDCSTGPAVKDAGGNRYLLTAGHCFHEGSALPKSGFSYRVIQGSHTLGASGPVMGSASGERVNNGYDLGIVAAGASALDWRSASANATTATATQIGSAGAVEGASVCFSGAFEGERCAAVVPTGGVNLTVQVCDSLDYCSWTVHLVHAVNASTWIVGPGDSGGPVYQVHATGLLVTGIIIASDSNYTGQCPNNNPHQDRLCSRGGYFGDISSYMNHLGVAIAP